MRVCLIYPNLYPLGMANLGFQTAYSLFNSLDWCACERAFLPEGGDLEEFARTGTRLFSYESATPINEFDVLAFSIPFEDDYINIPKILSLAGLPARSAERVSTWPLLLAGGVAVSLNPEPVADFIDVFSIGEGEGAIGPLLDKLREAKEKGLTKDECLRLADTIAWAYVPSFYEVSYNGPGIEGVKPKPGAKKRIKAAKNISLEDYPVPQSFITTPDTGFKDTFLMEVERGCPRGCRFCAAGFLYLPPRFRDAAMVEAALDNGIRASGKAGLVGTAVSEHPNIKDFIKKGMEAGGVVTLSSLRMDRLDGEFLELLKEGGYRTITLAPEAGTERMRGVINKGLTDSEIMESIRLIAGAGIKKIKLYFLVGLPTETDEDAQGIVELVKRIREEMPRGSEISMSLNPFVPKPFTPFQWHGFEDMGALDVRIGIIKKGLAKTGVEIKAMAPKEAFLQAYIARADRRAGELILAASKDGWRRVLKENREFLEKSVFSGRGKDEPLAWDILDHGIGKGYLWKEYQKGLKGGVTAPCALGSCFRCGVCRPEFFSK